MSRQHTTTHATNKIQLDKTQLICFLPLHLTDRDAGSKGIGINAMQLQVV